MKLFDFLNSVSSAFQRHQDFRIPFGETVNYKPMRKIQFSHPQLSRLICKSHSKPGSKSGSGWSVSLFYSQSDNSTDSGSLARDLSNKCIRHTFFPLLSMADFHPEKRLQGYRLLQMTTKLWTILFQKGGFIWFEAPPHPSGDPS